MSASVPIFPIIDTPVDGLVLQYVAASGGYQHAEAGGFDPTQDQTITGDWTFNHSSEAVKFRDGIEIGFAPASIKPTGESIITIDPDEGSSGGNVIIAGAVWLGNDVNEDQLVISVGASFSEDFIQLEKDGSPVFRVFNDGAVFGSADIYARTSQDTRVRMGSISGLAGLQFGGTGSADTNLYRSAANTLKTDDAFIAGAGLDANSNKITSVADPTSDQDAATKKYVDDSFVMEDWHIVGEAGEPAFENDWTHRDGGFGKLAFRKDPMGMVHLTGEITDGTDTTNGLVFTLPTGYRPAADVRIPIQRGSSQTNQGFVNIQSDGEVRVSVDSDAGTDLRVSFFTDAPT